MNVVFLLPVVLIVFAFAVITGNTAKHCGRSFWAWFFISIPLPLISCLMLVLLHHKQSKPVDNQEIFFELNGIR